MTDAPNTKHGYVPKVWGAESWLVNNELYCFKVLFLNQQCECSFHHHPIKDETFVVWSGRVLMRVGDEPPRVLGPESTVRIFPGTPHQFTGLTSAVIYKISTTHREDDSVRHPAFPSRRIPDEEFADLLETYL